MQLHVLQSIQGGLGTWLNLETGKTIVAPVQNGTVSLSVLDDNTPVMREDGKCYFPNLEPEEDENA